MLRSLVLAALAASSIACGSSPSRQPKPALSLDERRAVPIIAQAFKDESDAPGEGREIRLTSGKPLRVDVASAGHKYGVAYVTAADLAGLDAKTDLPPRSSAGDLAVVQGSGPDAGAVILVLFADDYRYDDRVSKDHESPAITAEKKLSRDVRDFLVQARARKLP